MEIEYEQVGDYLYPKLTVEDHLKGEKKFIGKYGRMRLKHLRENDELQLTMLMQHGNLTEHLASVDERARDYVHWFMEEMRKKEQISEDLKDTDPMQWVGRMNNIKAQAEEIVMHDLIFA